LYHAAHSSIALAASLAVEYVASGGKGIELDGSGGETNESGNDGDDGGLKGESEGDDINGDGEGEDSCISSISIVIWMVMRKFTVVYNT
jgi:hypothetical protein